MNAHHLAIAANGVEKTRLLETRIFEGALDPAVRGVAVRMMLGVPRGDHVERLSRLHRFVRDAVPYHREPVEMFQRAGITLELGGDCDCLVILLGALAWSLRYPWAVEPVTDPMDPDHYTVSLGYPTSQDPHGDRHTHWIYTEAAAAAAFGESPLAAARRRAPL